MITWNNPNEILPPIDKEDQFNRQHEISKEVLVHYSTIFDGNEEKYFSFGTYYKEHKQWVLVGFRGEFTVLGWSELNHSKFE